MESNKERSEEIKKHINQSSLDIKTNNSTIGIKCDSMDHDDENLIREGNRAYAIVVNSNNSWNIINLVCHRCSVRDVVERIVGSDKECVGIVEATVRVNFSEDSIILQSPKIWELMKV
jgi:hypothetical protein